MSAFLPILLQKSFGADERNFLGPLTRFVRSDVRDHIVLTKIGHGPSYRRYSALQRQGSLKINFREIFGVVLFSTFATVSAPNEPAAAAPACRLLGGRHSSFPARSAFPEGHDFCFYHGSGYLTARTAACAVIPCLQIMKTCTLEGG
jgi:hypothetical protein